MVPINLERKSSCEWANEKLFENANFLSYVLFTDETTFHKKGFINSHKLDHYNAENSHFKIILNLNGR